MKPNKLRSAIIQTLIPATALSVAIATSSAQAGDMQSKEDTAYQERSYVYDGEMADEKRSAKEYWKEFKQDSKQTWGSTKEAFRDGWVEGKLETALILNEYLNPFEIDIEVNDNVATLEGTVGSDLDKELATNVAMGIEGIDKVENRLEVSKDAVKSEEPMDGKRNFSQYMDDVSTTAGIKTDLLTSDNVSGLDINVDTYKNVVFLRGEVKSQAQKDLAEAIASRHDDVVKVVNQLAVNS